MIERIRKVGWTAVEAASLLIILCLLLNVILGESSGAFIAGVAGNTTRFLQEIPAGALLGVVLLAVMYGWYRARGRP